MSDKVVSIKEWNELIRRCRRLRHDIDQSADHIVNLQLQIEVLHKTFIFPSGKQLGS